MCPNHWSDFSHQRPVVPHQRFMDRVAIWRYVRNLGLYSCVGSRRRIPGPHSSDRPSCTTPAVFHTLGNNSRQCVGGVGRRPLSHMYRKTRVRYRFRLLRRRDGIGRCLCVFQTVRIQNLMLIRGGCPQTSQSIDSTQWSIHVRVQSSPVV